MGKVLSEQTHGFELASLAPMQKQDVVAFACITSAGWGQILADVGKLDGQLELAVQRDLPRFSEKSCLKK